MHFYVYFKNGIKSYSTLDQRDKFEIYGNRKWKKENIKHPMCRTLHRNISLLFIDHASENKIWSDGISKIINLIRLNHRKKSILLFIFSRYSISSKIKMDVLIYGLIRRKYCKRYESKYRGRFKKNEMEFCKY